MKVNVVNLQNTVVGDCDLPDDIFSLEPRSDIISRVITWQLAKRRSGNHSVKERPEVSGSTKKIVKQKGSGGARHGSKRGAQFRGGGIIFGPVVRSHAHSLPKKIRLLGLKMALASKYLSGRCAVVDDLVMSDVSTKKASSLPKLFGSKSILFLSGPCVDALFSSSIANIPGLDVLPTQGANVYDIIRKDLLVLSKSAVVALQERMA